MTRSFHRLGFTMIELLVVIAVIGLLAVTVLSTINPIEQINKSRDASSQSDASQLIAALDRYYASNEMYPWNKFCETNTSCQAGEKLAEQAFPIASGQACAPVSSGAGAGSCLLAGGTSVQVDDWLSFLSNTNEVKDTFLRRIYNRGASTQEQLWLYKADGIGKSVAVCFKPRSNQQKRDAITTCLKYQASLAEQGLPTSACPANDYATLTTETAITTAIASSRNELICMPLGTAK